MYKNPSENNLQSINLLRENKEKLNSYRENFNNLTNNDNFQYL
jgi:hypothetical protein